MLLHQGEAKKNPEKEERMRRVTNESGAKPTKQTRQYERKKLLSWA